VVATKANESVANQAKEETTLKSKFKGIEEGAPLTGSFYSIKQAHPSFFFVFLSDGLCTYDRATELFY
jgi:hypothetical protein